MTMRLILIGLILAPFFAGCGGGGGGHSAAFLPPSAPSGGSNSGTAAHPNPSPTADEAPAHDTLLGGIAIGADGLVYASGEAPPSGPTGKAGLEQYTPSLAIVTPPGASSADTWPVTTGLRPSGAVKASGSLVNALATTTGTAAAAGTVQTSASGPVEPVLVQFDTSSQTWLPVTFVDNLPGHIFVDFVQGVDLFGQPYIVGDEPGPTGYIGFIATPNATCAPPPFSFIVDIQPEFAGPLVAFGTGAFDNNGNMWIASDPELNSKKPSDPTTNPSEIFEINGFLNQVTQRIVIPQPGSQIRGMVLGPDNAIWFTDSGLNKVGRIAPSGALSYPVSLPTAGSVPERITVGSDGALWFTELHGNKIGRITITNATSTPKYTLSEIKGLKGLHPHGIIGCQSGSPCPAAGTVYFTEDTNIGRAKF